MMNKFGAFTPTALIGLVVVACGDIPSKRTNNTQMNNTTGVSTGTIEATPNPVSFEPVAVGQSSVIILRVYNSGEGVLDITSIELIEDTDSDDAGVEFQLGWVRTSGLQNDEFIPLKLMYLPRDDSPDTGRIVIATNDDSLPDGLFTIPIEGFAPNICSDQTSCFNGLSR